MKKLLMVLVFLFSLTAGAKAQYSDYGNYSDRRPYTNNYEEDRYYYEDDFDWHWDIRVRISNGIEKGLLTRNEANRLYRQLENVEKKEYAYQEDGRFSAWEQQEIWDDVVALHRNLGMELSDLDRRFYGFDGYGYNRQGFGRWFYGGGYDFYRFDKRGFGSIRLGYAPRSNYYGWYRHERNRFGREHYESRDRVRHGFEDNTRWNRPRNERDFDRRRDSGGFERLNNDNRDRRSEEYNVERNRGNVHLGERDRSPKEPERGNERIENREDRHSRGESTDESRRGDGGLRMEGRGRRN